MSDDASPFDRLLGHVGAVAQQVIRQITPPCSAPGCEEPSIPFRCVRCGRFSCSTHGFFNVAAASVCGACVTELCGRPPIDPSWPWGELGLHANATKAEVNKAFRRAAKQRHPDAFTDPVEKQKASEAWARLQAARTEALKRIDKRGGRR